MVGDFFGDKLPTTQSETTVICTNEDHSRRAKRYRYCFNCGEPLAVEKYPDCPYCRKTTYKSWFFCGWCGHQLRPTETK